METDEDVLFCTAANIFITEAMRLQKYDLEAGGRGTVCDWCRHRACS